MTEMIIDVENDSIIPVIEANDKPTVSVVMATYNGEE